MDSWKQKIARAFGSGLLMGCCLLGLSDNVSAQEDDFEPWVITDVFDDGYGNNWFTDNGFELGGYSQWGYQNNPDGAFTGNGPFLNQREWNNLNLNQQYLYLGKVADGSDGFDWGFRADLFYGVDGNEGQSFGNIDPGHFDYLNGWDHGIYEWAMPQLYGEVAMGDLSVKAGHFYTLIGYEVIPSTGQFFLSRQLTFWNSEPFTHTGALATYKVNDKMTATGGWVLGMDTGFYQYNQGNSFLGGFSYQIDEDTFFSYNMIGGNLGWRGDGSINSFILTHNWTDKISTAHQFDVLQSNLGSNFNNLAAPNGGIAGDSTGFINYAFYEINDQLKAGVRGEWYKADGVSYYTATYGVNIFPHPNLRIRPEVRHMFSPNHQTYTGSGYNDQLFNQTVFGIDAIVTF